jgi:hypothetical protein
MSPVDIGAAIRHAQNRSCEVDMGAGRECGETAVATVLGKRVCAWHQDSAAEIAAYVQNLMRGLS